MESNQFTSQLGQPPSEQIADYLRKPSLKFDVQLVSLPNTVHAQVEPW